MYNKESIYSRGCKSLTKYFCDEKSWLLTGTETRVGEERMDISRYHMINKLKVKLKVRMMNGE